MGSSGEHGMVLHSFELIIAKVKILSLSQQETRQSQGPQNAILAKENKSVLNQVCITLCYY